MNQLPPKTAMTLINNLYLYIAEDVEPAPLRGSAAFLQNIMLSHEKRAKTFAENGRKGSEIKWERAKQREKVKTKPQNRLSTEEQDRRCKEFGKYIREKDMTESMTSEEEAFIKFHKGEIC